tara:strand:+ start:328 stop:756 length:429 start_codon:yes stop_codon:yes gene_type:complete
MKIPSKLLQQAYYSTLNGNVSYGGSNVPVFDVVPPTQDYPYIQLVNTTISSQGTKSSFMTEAIVDVDVVTGFEGAFGGKSQAFDIGDTVTGLIVTRAQSYFSLSGFHCFISELDSSAILEEFSETHTLYIHKLSYRHLIQET